MEAKDLRKKSLDELYQVLKDTLKEQFNLRMQKGLGQTVRPHLFGLVRRDIARIKMVIGEKRRERNS
jgi:large subunit ribosomal protein L29